MLCSSDSEAGRERSRGPAWSPYLSPQDPRLRSQLQSNLRPGSARPMIVAILVITFCLAKLLDSATLYVRMIQRSLAVRWWPGSDGDPELIPAVPESYVFERLQRHLEPSNAEPAKHRFQRVTLVGLGLLWRAPILVVVTGGALAIVTSHRHGLSAVIAAATCVAVAMGPVLTVTLAIALPGFDSEAILAVAGFHVTRATDRSRVAKNAASPATVLIGEATGFIVGFSILYYTLSASEGPNAFHGHHLDLWLATYFAITTGATIGAGDVYATTDGAQLAVALQLLATAAAITLYAGLLIQMLVKARSIQ